MSTRRIHTGRTGDARCAVEVCAASGVTFVRVGGRLDARSVAEVRDTLHQAIDAGCGRVVIELPDAEIGDATALGLLVGAHHRARRIGRELVVGEVSERTARLLRMSHLDRVLGQPPAAGRARRAVAALTA